MKTASKFMAALLVLSATTTAAFAHHSFAMFDRSKRIRLSGTVKEFQFTNPHVWVQVIVADAKTGKTTEWGIESVSVSNLKRSGWNRNSLKPGDKVVLTIFPLISGKPGGGALIDATVDGKLLSLGSY